MTSSLEDQAALTSGDGLWTTKATAGLPSITLTDGPHGVRHTSPATCFPPAVALGSSWDPALLRRVGEALGVEARALDVQVLLGPGVNIKRSPLCGRNFEYLSEDPRLSGVLGAALVAGVQSQGVGACVKHFAANNQETGRMRVSSEADERTLREIYLPAFEHIVKTAQPWTVMCSYNRVNGEYASENRWLLTEVLREEWGFDGVVVSDWGAVNDRVAALRAGLDLEMPTTGGFTDAQLVDAVRRGELPAELVAQAADRVRALVERSSPGSGVFDAVAHHALAREVAAQCAVLLKNDGVLPLTPGDSIAVVGELARSPRYQGAGSSQLTPTQLDNTLSFLGDVPFAPGYRLDTSSPDPLLEEEARQVASGASVTVVFLGLPASQESEGFDREHLDLPSNQLAVLSAVASTGTRVVVVLANGGVVTVSGWQDHADAILEGWLLGQAGGGAIADLLFGVVNPSGRLAETIPVRLADTPSYLTFPGEFDRVRYAEGVFVGYRHHDAVEGEVSYPFGHGLSYTTFSYSDLTLSTDGRDEEATVTVSFTVTNTGSRAGAEVAQVYVSAPSQAVRRPVRELRAWSKTLLSPGESVALRFTLKFRDFAYFDPSAGWTAEGGPVGIHVGASSRDLRLSGVAELDITPPLPVLTEESSLAEWVAVPVGRAVLADEMSPGSRFLTDDYIRTIGSVPLSRLARYPGTGLHPSRLPALVAKVFGNIERR
ncbi:glycoside hydrolase family 3 C-terminal domain-containing protein [Nonomuraea sp. NPDC050556]|uniref:glycoside hydrolase family 3 C-terminal domain-containing protein n=1 Tax=Nonomuraea sp. NPDC050556 TaxID=3364369 RepID=UPI0037B660A9